MEKLYTTLGNASKTYAFGVSFCSQQVNILFDNDGESPSVPKIFRFKMPLFREKKFFATRFKSPFALRGCRVVCFYTSRVQKKEKRVLCGFFV